ncbi:NAD-dependent epimerase/dehydratase family protein [Arthrobacter agilis]|uniref:NAD-dependent epimerase/dehydratase family protein n=1 Tax=Arthrobacter agilis TaxID=37921 RepID=UPI0027843960|nr:NAD-dependent epimerase/dehydratase family protein [Arthrobacter agilis]MDQ0735437.1 nucleoside-diphosphate-sugar epimerase [Arthrobacter agilis]
MTWLVLGASGFVGSAIMHALRSGGIDARGLPAPRLAASAQTPAALLEAAAGTDVQGLAAAMEGHDVVVNAAGLATPSASGGEDLLGANALLPAVLARAAAAAGTRRFIHLSSAAVQGRTERLDETDTVRPFSAYSRSKALGEQALALAADRAPGLSVVTVRATSVQGRGRPTTASLARLAQSPLASVASPGDARSPITSVEALADLVLAVGRHGDAPPRIVLQPWEGLTVRTVLEAVGGRPHVLPSALCRVAVRGGYGVSALLRGRLDGHVRRVELMWFGQDQAPGWALEEGLAPEPRVRAVLAEAQDRARTPGAASA